MTYLAEALDINRQLHHLLLNDNLQVTSDAVEEFIRVLQQDGEYANTEIGSIDLTRPPMDHEVRPGSHTEATKRFTNLMNQLDELLARNRQIKEETRRARQTVRHPHYPHHPRKLWAHEGSVAGDMSIISLDGEALHFATPEDLAEDSRVPLPMRVPHTSRFRAASKA